MFIGAWIGCRILTGTAFGQESAGATPSTGNTASSLEDAPWYDAESNRIVPIHLVPRQDDSVNRDSRWLPKPETVKKATSTTTSGATGGGGTGGGTGLYGSEFTLGNLFGWVLLVAIVMAIVGGIVFAVTRAELNGADRRNTNNNANGKDDLPDEQTLERIKHLPPELRRTDVNLRTECERLMGEGMLHQAIILLLGHQLLLLDRYGLLRLSRGKTNGKYVRETRANDDQCASWLRGTADAFEQSYFGRHEIPTDVFAQLWAQNEALESAAVNFGGEK